MKYFTLIFALLFLFAFCKLEESNFEDKLDTSDNNPIAYCLRQRNGFDEEQILKFLIEIQDPSKAVAIFPYGGKLSKCVQERLKEVSGK